METLSSPAITELSRWLAGQGAGPAAQPLAGDVSPRRYFRVRIEGGGSAIAAWYPQGMRSVCARFAATTELLAAAGVRVPDVLASDCSAGFQLLEDVGERTLYEWAEVLPAGRLAVLLEQAVGVARRIAALAPSAVATLGNPPLDSALLRRELTMTWEVFLEPRGLAGQGGLRHRLAACFDQLAERLGAQPPVVCHRDFMARNLIPTASGELALLDHQDLRLGPPAYDLASLLNDSLFPEGELANRLAAQFSPTLAHTDYCRAAAQRGLKAVGSFAAFAARGVPRHLKLIPPTLARAWQNLRQLPEGEAVAREIEPWWRREFPAARVLTDS